MRGLKIGAVLSAFSLMASCHLERPDQDNFVLDAKNGGITPFIKAASKNFDTSASQTPINITGSDRTVMFTLEAEGILIVIDPIPDDRCNPHASTHATYNDGQYRIDLVYKTSSRFIRSAAKQQLLTSAAQVKQPLTTFTEC